MFRDNASAITFKKGKTEKKKREDVKQLSGGQRGGGASLMGLAGLTLWPPAGQPTGPNSARPGCKKWRGDEK